MSRIRRGFVSLSLAAALLPAAARSEVSVTRLAGGDVEFFFEASPTGPWGRVRPETATVDMLNSQGDWRSDGWPAIRLDGYGKPAVAYATAGNDSELWLAWHDGAAWRPAVNVSRRTGCDSGPALALDAWGNRFLSWNNTRGSRKSVMFAGVRNDGAGLTGVLELSARQRDVRVPSVGIDAQGDAYVAYEEQANGDADVPYIAIDRLVPEREPDWSLHCSGENTPDLWRSATIRTGLTDRNVLAEATVNVEAGHLWVTWIDSRVRVGWVEQLGPGVFSEPAYRPFEAAEGPAEALGMVRDQVLAP